MQAKHVSTETYIPRGKGMYRIQVVKFYDKDGIFRCHVIKHRRF